MSPVCTGQFVYSALEGWSESHTGPAILIGDSLGEGQCHFLQGGCNGNVLNHGTILCLGWHHKCRLHFSPTALSSFSKWAFKGGKVVIEFSVCSGGWRTWICCRKIKNKIGSSLAAAISMEHRSGL